MGSHPVRRPPEAGFTVVEIAISMAVLGIGLLALAALMPLLKIDDLRSGQRTRASFLAEESAEWLHGLAYDDSLLQAGTWIDEQFGVPGYQRRWTVETDVPQSGIKRVTIQIERADRATAGARVVFLHAEAGR